MQKTISFVKMEGAGNDYIYVDATIHDLPMDQAAELARHISDRNFGVGGDGLIVLAQSSTADVRMLMWNADGSQGAMCGNGIRCLAKMAFEHGVTDKEEMTVETDSGLRKVKLTKDANGTIVGAQVDMGQVSVRKVEASVVIDGREWLFYPGDAGNPHAVIFLDKDPDLSPVLQVGTAFQALSDFTEGVNVEFVQVLPDNVIKQRTFERGSGETLACGSGATVAALAAMETGRLPGPSVRVELRGGALIVRREGSSLVMEGPARTVFSGEFPWPEIGSLH